MKVFPLPVNELENKVDGAGDRKGLVRRKSCSEEHGVLESELRVAATSNDAVDQVCSDHGSEASAASQSLESVQDNVDEQPAEPQKYRTTLAIRFEAQQVLDAKAQLCLEVWCMDADPAWWQILVTLCQLTMFAAVLVSAVGWVYVLFPFEKPEAGFWRNWIFNCIAHPIANYIVGAGPISWFMRQVLWDLELRADLRKTTRPDISRHLHYASLWVPMIDSFACWFVHVLFSIGDIYPIPFSVPVSCLPASFLGLGVFYRVMPKEVRGLQTTTTFLKYTVSTLCSNCALYSIMLVYVASFAKVGATAQVAMNLGTFLFESLVVKIMKSLGKRWSMPLNFIREMMTIMKLPVLIFKATMLSKATGALVSLSMIVPEGIQMVGSLLAVMRELTADNRDAVHYTSFMSRRHIVQTFNRFCDRVKLLRCTLKDMSTTCKAITKKELVDATWSEEDVRVLNAVCSSFSALAMLGVCEFAAPVIYMSLLLCIQSNTFLQQNSSYFLEIGDSNLNEGLILNSYSLALEAAILIVTDLCTRALIGMSFLGFLSSALRCDFGFWLKTFTLQFLSWLTILVKHTGHDWTFQFSWL